MPTKQIQSVLRPIIVGTVSSVVAFFATLGLATMYDEQFFMLMVAAVAYSCWHVNWRAGAVSTFFGIIGVILLLPPRMHLIINGSLNVVRLLIFFVTGSMICFLSY